MQSQSCWHPSPYVPSLQPVLGGEIQHMQREILPRDPACSQEEDEYLSDSARHGAQRDTGTDQ